MSAPHIAPAWARALLRLHPAWFRERWGAEVQATLLHTLATERGRGGWAARLSPVRAALDLARSAVRVHAGGSRRPPSGRPVPGGGWGGDVRYALRSLARQPVMALSTVLTLTIGIGASTVVFSLVYGFLFRPLPYADGERLVMVWSRNDARGWSGTDVSVPDARDWEARSGVFAGLTVIGRSTLTLTGRGEAELLAGNAATHEIFDVLGVWPALGRGFLPEDGKPGAPGVVVLSDGFWRRRFAADPGVIGEVVMLNGTPHTVVGVLAPSFRLIDAPVDAIVALREDPSASRDAHSHLAVGRLAPGVSLERAQRAVADVAARLATEHPETNEGWSADVVGLRDDALGAEGRAAVTVLSGAIVFLLAMVCVNIANLLLARGRARRREMAVRASLGAGRVRLIRQLLTESAVLAFTGGALGAAASFAGVRVIVAALPPQMPPLFEFAVDLPVLLFALAVSIMATLAFGLPPALRDSRATASALREEGRGGAGRRGRQFGSVLVVVQMTLAVVLLIGGTTLGRSVAHMQSQELGYVPERLLTLRVSPPESDYADAQATQALHDELAAGFAALPGVVATGSIHSLPLRGSNFIGTFTLPGASEPEGWPARMNWISPGYTDAIQLPVRAGRSITAEDRPGQPCAVLVNEILVRQRMPEGNVIGRTLIRDGDECTIVGVVADALDRSLLRPPEPSLYLAAAQHGARSRNHVLRTEGDPATLAPAVRRVIASVDPNLPPYEIQPFTTLVAERLMPFRLIAGLMLGFALISLVLAAVGLYGVTAYGVGRRSQEIGLRLAVGAEPHGVVRMLVGEGMRRALAGVTLGIVLAIPLSGALRSIAVGVNPSDPLVFGGVAVTLLGVALLGTWLPSRRAVRLDPMKTLGAQ